MNDGERTTASGLARRGAPLLLALLLLAIPAAAHAQGGAFRVNTQARLPLSIAQEADGAIDRAQRWLAAQAAPTGDLARAWLRRYALAPARAKPVPLPRCLLTPLQEAMPPATPAAALTNLTATLAQTNLPPRALFALQRDLPAATPPPDWRERLALALIDAQRVTPQGGHWQTPEETVWAILTLRALLNESTPVQPQP